MAQRNYAWLGTDLTLFLEEEVAGNFNEAQDAFFAAQMKYMLTNGEKWDGTGGLEIEWTDEQAAAFNGIADLINALVALNGGSLEIPKESVKSRYLVVV